MLNLANGDMIVSSIINGVGGLRCVHHGVEVGEVGGIMEGNGNVKL
jgi:hypothetical protein